MAWSSRSSHSGVMSTNSTGAPVRLRNREATPSVRSITRRIVGDGRSHAGQLPFQEAPPACLMLSPSSNRKEVAIWRKTLMVFEKKLSEFNRRQGCRYDPPLHQFVHPSIWSTISEQLVTGAQGSNPDK